MARYPRQDDPGGKNVIPSVTEIISDCTDKSGALTQWAANMCKLWIQENCDALSDWDENNEERLYYEVFDSDLEKARFNFKTVSQKALDIGSEVHAKIELYLKEQLKGNHPSGYNMATTIEDEQAQNSFIAFLKWAEEHNVKPIRLEQTVYSHDGLWAGTLDLNCWLNGKRYIIDFKTSKAFYPEHRYQVAAYRLAIEDETLHEEDFPEGCGILRLDKESGKPSWHDTSKTFEKDLRVFQAMFELYKLRHPIIIKRAT